MSQPVTVEVSQNGTIRIIGAAEYESSAVVQLALAHHQAINKANAQAKVWAAIIPWLAVTPVFLVFLTLIWLVIKPAPTVEYNYQGAISHVQQA